MISDAKAFVYTGKAMEPWAEQIIDVIEEKCVVVDTSKNIDMINSDKFMEVPMNMFLMQLKYFCEVGC